jgi:O-antigen ligase
MARAIVLTLAVLAALTVLQEFVLSNGSTLAGLSNVPVQADIGGATARHSGPQGDANFWGRVLLLGLPFALSLAHTSTSRRGTVLWTCCALSIGAGVVLTGSRGTLLGAFVVFCVWALLTGGRVAKGVALTPLVAGLVLLVPGVGSRLLTLSAVGADGLAVADPSLEGRVAAQRVALEMGVDHPVLGVGPGNFLGLSPDYLQRLAIDSVPLAPHNQYLEATAEGGLVGLAAWLLLLGAAAFTAARARILTRAGGPAVDREAPVALSNAVLAALVGWSVASVFLHLATFRTFLFMAALAAALDIRARRAVRRQREIPAGVVPAPRPERSAGLSAGARSTAALLVAALLVLAGALWLRAQPSDANWSASAGMQMTVNYAQDTDSPAYDLDTLSREGLVRTMGGIAASQRFTDDGLAQVAAADLPTTGITVKVSGSVRSGLFVFTATGPDPEAAAVAADAVRASAQRFLDEVSSLYVTQPVPGPPVVTETEALYDRRVALAPLVLGVLVAAWVSALALRARRVRDREAPQLPVSSS